MPRTWRKSQALRIRQTAPSRPLAGTAAVEDLALAHEAGDWIARLEAMRWVLRCTDLLVLMWNRAGILRLVEGRHSAVWKDAGRVFVGQPIAEAYAGSPVIEFVLGTLRGESRAVLLQTALFTYDVRYSPLVRRGRIVGGLAVAWPVDHLKSGTPDGL